MSDVSVMGVSGDVGSFSEEAAQQYLVSVNQSATLKYLIDMEGVLSAISAKKINLGIFPVVNIHGGLVRMAYDAMGNHPFKVVDELWLDVHQCLLVKPGTSRNQIKKIVSHSQALRQCKYYLAQHFANIECVESADTALAAKELAQGLLPDDCAVLAKKEAGEHYGLTVLAKNIEDEKPNLTAFIIVKNHGDV